MTRSHRPPRFPVPHWPTISVASCAAFCSNRSFICLMLNFSVSASTNFLSRTEKRRHVSCCWSVLRRSLFIKTKLTTCILGAHLSIVLWREENISCHTVLHSFMYFMINILKDLLASDVLELCLIPSLALRRTISPPDGEEKHAVMFLHEHTQLHDTHSSDIP